MLSSKKMQGRHLFVCLLLLALVAVSTGAKPKRKTVLFPPVPHLKAMHTNMPPGVANHFGHNCLCHPTPCSCASPVFHALGKCVGAMIGR